MTHKMIRSEDMLAALEAAGILRAEDRAYRVVIDLQVKRMPVIHIQRYGDDRLLNLVPTLEGVEIRRDGVICTHVPRCPVGACPVEANA